MSSRVSNMALAAVLVATFSAPLGALAADAAQTLTPQQQRMAQCNQTAQGKTGDARKAYMSSCLKGETPAAAVTPQQQRMKDCNAKAGEQALAGDQRKTFMSNCLSGKS